jgi:leader peptidase (prepilin peptidase)/N-methyltransferase
VLGLLAGLIFGSFIALLTQRWPAGRSVVRGRSHCDTCGQTLAARDLVPVLSMAALRARCRLCSAPIAMRHTWIEIAAGGIGAAALGLYPGLAGGAGAVLGWGLLIVAILDVEHFWLPDRVTLPLAGLGLLAGLITGPPIGDRVIGAVAAYLTLAAIAAGYRMATGRSGMGGGDPKLFAAIGAWLGWTALPVVLLLASLLGLTLVGLDRLRGHRVERLTRLPFGALLAVAAWPVWLVSSLAPLLLVRP